MGEVNLLGVLPKVVRDVDSRVADKERNRAVALRYGREYFDGPREQGYGGYVYDGRWKPVARRIVERYGLGPGDRVLDIGCAKGFLVHDLGVECPGLEVYGLDISHYALTHAHHGVSGRLVEGSADYLPFPDDSFSVVLAINILHNLEVASCIRALREIVRLTTRGAFVQVDAYRDELERLLFEDWVLTAKTYMKPEDWKALFAEAGYGFDYFWTILEADRGAINSSRIPG